VLVWLSIDVFGATARLVAVPVGALRIGWSARGLPRKFLEYRDLGATEVSAVCLWSVLIQRWQDTSDDLIESDLQGFDGLVVLLGSFEVAGPYAVARPGP